MTDYDLIVVGGGHAGVEASHAGATLGLRTLLLTLNKKMIGNMPCNPHIGGSAKGILVREIDALGGLMGIAADRRPLQIKMLNTGKGPGVQCLRSQQDKGQYPAYVLALLEQTPRLTIQEGEVKKILVSNGRVSGVRLGDGSVITASKVILTTGTYMNGRIISGKEAYPGGPDGEPPSLGLSECLEELGISLIRLKTGTPPRLKKSTIDFSKGEIQEGSKDPLAFSFATKEFVPFERQLPCYLIYAGQETIDIVKNNISQSAVFDGTIQGTGPRYCPAFESKVVRFADKPRHQLFLEPEYENGESIYLQGFSTGMPHEIQEQMVHSLPGLEHAEILKWAYQIEYDAVRSTEYDETLMIKKIPGLYVAGQICGTSGYEEAAGLGLWAGVNAANAFLGKPPFSLKRNQAYLGVMVDDLVTKGTDEPYRLLSSRAEYRLLLRHDNADERLSEIGWNIGLLSGERYALFQEKQARIQEALSILSTHNISDREGLNQYLQEMGFPPTNDGKKGLEMLKRPRFTYPRIRALMMDVLGDLDLDFESVLALETKVKYEGYLAKEEKEAKNFIKEENMLLPHDIDYLHMDGLRLEARQKLDAIRPTSIGQASRIAGVNPADISILMLYLKKEKRL
ncbi:MAG: tRNA uridine-5-carboxymethylaminomethyl(34) synthesis enzyme MnmG [Candidatus Enteromonas sp.]|nr:tRNA uridine-5-carboxymethylaminomethyl(34) synthesis enzyme MnmG [Candidatus Enteromonas sp.]